MFRWASYGAVLIFAYVGFVLLVMPSAQIATLGLAVDAGGQVMGRRSGVLYLLVAALGLYFAHQPPGEARTVFATLWALSLVMVAGIGTQDLLVGRAERAIILVIAVECVMAAALLFTMRRQ